MEADASSMTSEAREGIWLGLLCSRERYYRYRVVYLVFVRDAAYISAVLSEGCSFLACCSDDTETVLCRRCARNDSRSTAAHEM